MTIKKLCKALLAIVAIFTVMSIGINSVNASGCIDPITKETTMCPE